MMNFVRRPDHASKHFSLILPSHYRDSDGQQKRFLLPISPDPPHFRSWRADNPLFCLTFALNQGLFSLLAHEDGPAVNLEQIHRRAKKSLIIACGDARFPFEHVVAWEEWGVFEVGLAVFQGYLISVTTVNRSECR